MRIGFLGTGLMGTPMVRNLCKAGFELHIWNRTPDKAQLLSDIAQVHSTPADAAAEVDIVIAMLYDGPVTSAVLIDNGVIDAMKQGSLILNMGSIEPGRDRQLAAQAQARGLRYLGAPVSGGVKGAEDATLTIFVGGKESDMQSAQPVFNALGKPHLIGPDGAGQSAKLANQLIVAITIGAVAEAFKLAESAGCDPAILRQALRGGFADSRILDLHGERMVQRNFIPGGRSASQLKDIHNALSVADAAGLKLPLSNNVEQNFRSLVEDYDGADLDHSAYYLWLEKINQQ